MAVPLLTLPCIRQPTPGNGRSSAYQVRVGSDNGRVFAAQFGAVLGKQTAAHELVSTTLNNGVPQGYRDLLIRSTPGVWLTVTPPGPAAAPAKRKK